MIVSDDGISVLGAVLRDMRHRFVQIRDDADRHNRREIFGVPIINSRVTQGGNARRSKQGAAFGAAAHFNLLGGINFGNRYQRLPGNGSRHQQGLHCVAGRVALCLGIVGNGNGLFNVCGIINIDMAHTIKMFDHWHSGFVSNFCGEAFAAARDDHIDHAAHTEHFGHGGAVGGGDQLHTIIR